jgi:hypothetical protein
MGTDAFGNSIWQLSVGWAPGFGAVWIWNDYHHKSSGNRTDVPVTAKKEANLVWSEYRRIKHRLVILLFGWLPFGLILGAGLPVMFGTFTPSYVLATAYVIYTAFTFLQYGLYPCPNCGTTYRCRQLYRRTCPHCGVEIDKPSSV